MKNLFRQYWMPALLTVLLHLLASNALSHWLGRRHSGNAGVIGEDTAGCIFLLPPILPEAHVCEDGIDIFDVEIFANGENPLRLRKPPFFCCFPHEWDVPPPYARPEVHVEHITRIDLIEMPEQRMIVGMIGNELDCSALFPRNNTRAPKHPRTSMNMTGRHTTRIPWLGGRR